MYDCFEVILVCVLYYCFQVVEIFGWIRYIKIQLYYYNKVDFFEGIKISVVQVSCSFFLKIVEVDLGEVWFGGIGLNLIKLKNLMLQNLLKYQ